MVRGVTAGAVVEGGTGLIVHMVVRVHGAPHPVVPEEEGMGGPLLMAGVAHIVREEEEEE